MQFHHTQPHSHSNTHTHLHLPLFLHPGILPDKKHINVRDAPTFDLLEALQAGEFAAHVVQVLLKDGIDAVFHRRVEPALRFGVAVAEVVALARRQEVEFAYVVRGAAAAVVGPVETGWGSRALGCVEGADVVFK